MTLTFTSRIDGRQIRCEIGTDRALAAPVFCFSLMAAPKVVSGGTLVRRVAGYAEVALPDLAAGAKHEVVLEHAVKEFGPRNRAWLPLGAYLRVGKECMALPPGNDLGLREVEVPPPPPLAPDRLPLVPQPTDWRPSGGELAFAELAPVAGLDHGCVGRNCRGGRLPVWRGPGASELCDRPRRCAGHAVARPVGIAGG